MRTFEPITKKQIEILLKCHYMKYLKQVAEDENLSISQVCTIRSRAIFLIRIAYGPLYQADKEFDGEAAIKYMAKNSNMTVNQLSEQITSYIMEGLIMEQRKFWLKVRKKGNIPSPAELLEFLFVKYETQIIGDI